MKKYIISAFALAFVLGLAGSVMTANAGGGIQYSPPIPLHGWAWSSTIGWVSFNSADSGTGTGGTGTSPTTYSVMVATSSADVLTGIFSGYAWSSNVGWISFNNDASSNLVSDCGQVANLDLPSGQVSGWARAISGVGRTDGWNGCVNLSGTAADGGTYGATLGVNPLNASTYGKFSGLTWGDANVGWLSFAGVVCPGCVGQPDTQPNLAKCTVAPSSSISPGTQVTFTASAPSSGWATPYSYAWSNGCSGTSQTCIINSPTNGLKPTVVISDSGTNTASPLCPTINVSGPNPTATVTCSPSTPVSAASQTYSVTSTGLTAPLTYLWTGGGTATPMTYNYTVTPQVTVTGSNGYQIGSCGTLTVPSGGTGDIDLRAFRSPGLSFSTGVQTVRIAVGKPAYLGWKTGLPTTAFDGYSCNGAATKNGDPAWTSTSWIVPTTYSDQSPSENSASDVSPSANRLSIGNYTFQIVCTKNISMNNFWSGLLSRLVDFVEASTPPIVSNIVNIIVTSSSVEEI